MRWFDQLDQLRREQNPRYRTERPALRVPAPQPPPEPPPCMGRENEPRRGGVIIIDI